MQKSKLVKELNMSHKTGKFIITLELNMTHISFKVLTVDLLFLFNSTDFHVMIRSSVILIVFSSKRKDTKYLIQIFISLFYKIKIIN